MNKEQQQKLQREFDFILNYINDNLDDTQDIKNCFDRVEMISKKLKKHCYMCKTPKVKKYCKKIRIYFCKDCYDIYIKPKLKNKKSIKKIYFH